ncbi:MAG: T9SS type A sorting domain-containing protein [Bacteroidia bacterium]
MKLMISAICALISVGMMSAQSLVSSASAFDISPDKKTFLTWTLGEVAVETYIISGTNPGRLEEGFLFQKYTTWLTSIGVEPFARDAIQIYPNPVAEYLTIEINRDLSEKLSFFLIDAQGKTVKQGVLDISSHPTLFLGDLPTGVYWLNILGFKSGKYANFSVQKR